MIIDLKKLLKILKIPYVIIKFFLWITVISLLAITLTQRISNNTKAVAGFRIFTVVTESMVPVYNVGDAILVEQMDIEKLHVGDDITYLGAVDSFKDRIVTHRIISIEPSENPENGKYVIQTQGVANDEPDPKINETQIFGKVLYKIKIISKLNGVIGNLYSMYFIIIVPMALMIFFDFIIQRKQDEDDEIDEDDNKQKKNLKDDEDTEEINKEKAKKEKRKSRRNKRRNKRKKDNL